MPKFPQTVTSQPRLRGWCALLLCVLVIAIVWLGALPALYRRESVRTRIERLESRGIDASALFYTELDAQDGVLERVDRFGRDHPGAFWDPRSPSDR